jgi:hypothetical protein
MGGMYYFNCNGPVIVGPWGNYNEALQDCENTYGGPCQFLGCTQPPCGNNASISTDSAWTPDEKFIKEASERKKTPIKSD